MNAPETLPVDRRTFLGGSDCAAILGVSPWATPLDCFLEKTGQVKREYDPAREKLFRRGKLLEPIALQMLIEDYGIKVTTRSTPEKPNRHVDPEHPFIAAEIDFEWEVQQDDIDRWNLDPALLGTIQNGEVKTVHHFASAKFGATETEETPIEYAAQAMHGLMVRGRKLTLFAVLVGADELSVYFTHRDEETIVAMRAKLLAFWQRVLDQNPPDPVNLPDVLKLFRRTPAIEVEASEEVRCLVMQFEQAKDAARAAEGRAEDLKFQIGVFMLGESAIVREQKPRGGMGDVKPGPEPKPGTHVLTAGGSPILTVNFQQQTRLDNDRVRKDYPEVAAECEKQISFYRFDPPRKKKAA